MKPEVRNKLWRICKNTPVRSPLVLQPGEEPKIIPIQDVFFNKFELHILELGSGWGEVILELAKSNPKIGYIAMERKWNRLAQTDIQARKMNLSNLLLSGVNFQWFLRDLFLPESFDKIILNFPDPWPKKKHHKNRAINPDFLEIIYQLLKPGGIFQFATDHSGYARRAIQEFRKFGKFHFDSEEWSHSRPGFPISEFEREKRGEGKRIFYLDRLKS
jgi:tRNA (guanine-N7-)-methyltransferase